MLICFEQGTSSQLPFHPVLFILFLSFLLILYSIVTSSLACLQRPLLLAVYARTEHVTDLTQEQSFFYVCATLPYVFQGVCTQQGEAISFNHKDDLLFRWRLLYV